MSIPSLIDRFLHIWINGITFSNRNSLNNAAKLYLFFVRDRIEGCPLHFPPKKTGIVSSWSIFVSIRPPIVRVCVVVCLLFSVNSPGVIWVNTVVEISHSGSFFSNDYRYMLLLGFSWVPGSVVWLLLASVSSTSPSRWSHRQYHYNFR